MYEVLQCPSISDIVVTNAFAPQLRHMCSTAKRFALSQNQNTLLPR